MAGHPHPQGWEGSGWVHSPGDFGVPMEPTLGCDPLEKKRPAGRYGGFPPGVRRPLAAEPSEAGRSLLPTFGCPYDRRWLPACLCPWVSGAATHKSIPPWSTTPNPQPTTHNPGRFWRSCGAHSWVRPPSEKKTPVTAGVRPQLLVPSVPSVLAVMAREQPWGRLLPQQLLAFHLSMPLGLVRAQGASPLKSPRPSAWSTNSIPKTAGVNAAAHTARPFLGLAAMRGPCTP